MRAKSRGRRRLSRTNEVGEKKRAQKTAKKNSFSSFFFFLCLSLTLSLSLSVSLFPYLRERSCCSTGTSS